MTKCYWLLVLSFWITTINGASSLSSSVLLNWPEEELTLPGEAVSTAPPNPLATTASGSRFPPIYIVGDTSPFAIIFRVTAGVQVPIGAKGLTSTVIYGLNLLLQQCIARHGDGMIPANGIGFARGPNLPTITIKSYQPGRSVDLTYSWTAGVLRGIWELTSSYGWYSVDLEVYVGALNVDNLRGHASVYPGDTRSNLTVDSDAQIFTQSTE
ncbi:hypothetical protein ACLMJK_006226 [Lecanora helva]